MDKVFIDIREENKWIRKYFNKDLVTIDEMLGVIEDLDGEVEHLKEELKYLEQDIEDNYRPIPYKEQIGYSERDFI